MDNKPYLHCLNIISPVFCRTVKCESMQQYKCAFAVLHLSSGQLLVLRNGFSPAL